jgi:hypothetical protein
MRKDLTRIEDCVLVALKVAAHEYRKEYGRFLPFATKKIHDVFLDLDKKKIKWGHPIGYQRKFSYNMNAFRVSLTMFDRISLEDK